MFATIVTFRLSTSGGPLYDRKRHLTIKIDLSLPERLGDRYNDI